LSRTIEGDVITYSLVKVAVDRPGRRATITVRGPEDGPPATTAEFEAQGDQSYPLRLSRELDDAILHLRLNELAIGTLVFKSEGDPVKVLAYDHFMAANRDNWLVGEVLGNWRRVLKRIDVTSRSLVTLLEPGSCFAGTLAEIAFASDRAYMLDGTIAGDNRPEATLVLSSLNFGAYPMSNAITRLETRFLGEPETLRNAEKRRDEAISAGDADALGLVTESFDEIDYEDEVRIFLEERASFSADGLTGMEANLRFAGPETMETKIFGRLTAWQNWIFQRPNAVGPEGALKRYGSGVKGRYDPDRV
ncbi:MAG: benzoyl-CoA-dihydrodiol lyase, partial [Hyphomicrobiaceae bacterium]